MGARSVGIAALLGLAGCFLAAKVVGANAGPLAQSVNGRLQAGQDSKPFDQEAALAELRKRIAGQENKPAEEVWKNIQILKGRTAAQVLGVMRLGYSRSLGVTCTHCHVADRWESDDRQAKQTARDMALMTRAINTEYLKKIRNLKSASPVINCTTCHRGQTKPALDLPEDTPKQ